MSTSCPKAGVVGTQSFMPGLHSCSISRHAMHPLAPSPKAVAAVNATFVSMLSHLLWAFSWTRVIKAYQDVRAILASVPRTVLLFAWAFSTIISYKRLQVCLGWLVSVFDRDAAVSGSKSTSTPGGQKSRSIIAPNFELFQDNQPLVFRHGTWGALAHHVRTSMTHGPTACPAFLFLDMNSPPLGAG